MTVPAALVPDRSARLAVTAAFLANGAAMASWIARIPDVRSGLGMSEATLGMVLLGMALGTIVALPLAGGLVARIGSRAVTVTGAIGIVVVLPLLGLAPSPWSLAATLAAFGASVSTMDIGMNAQGVGVERGYGRSILVGLHAAWSVGSLLGALAATVAVRARVPVEVHLTVVALVVAATVAVLARWLRVRDRAVAGTSSPRFALPRGALVPVALICFASALGEGTASDWSGIHLDDVVGVAPERVTWGYVAFTAAMTLARLLGDRVTRRFGPAAVVRASGAVAGLGFVLVTLVPTLPAAVAGFALAGAGLAPIVPLCFSAAGRLARSPGEGVAAVATIGYGGFLAGPPLIGVLTEQLDLRVPLFAVGVFVLVMTLRPAVVAAEAAPVEAGER
ncbi:MFS transporter [Egicoccus halophilus]|uniref:MFS transporter n=1 Tax=Egicoccus halophilus TaxID=1670830 RepID=A0A8J3ERL8_9ACTN|nr:MFS transporter [Egicoccus halophilus]GGI05230.1 MFS transporter [Egicoccus halophilus]